MGREIAQLCIRSKSQPNIQGNRVNPTAFSSQGPMALTVSDSDATPAGQVSEVSLRYEANNQ